MIPTTMVGEDVNVLVLLVKGEVKVSTPRDSLSQANPYVRPPSAALVFWLFNVF